MLLLILDIDGTLVQAKGAGALAMRDVMQETYGVADPFSGILLSGRTDRQIIEDACSRLELPLPRWEPFIQRLSEHLRQHLAQNPGYLLPHVATMLDRLAAASDRVRLVLGTGNFCRCAYDKLAVHGIDRYFLVGGFGEDGPARAQVIAQAQARARHHYGVSFDHALVVGDTPLDIEAAHATDLPCVSVTTGTHDHAKLAEAGADYIMSDFSQLPDAIFQLTGAIV